MNSRWWRAYDEAIDDPKLQCLSDECFRFWFNLCCVCSLFRGNLPPEKHLAFKLRMQERKIRRLLGELRMAGLIDDDNQGSRPHNWHGRQYKGDVSTERVKRFRKRKRNASETLQKRPQNTETEKKEPKLDSKEESNLGRYAAEPELFCNAVDVVDEDPKARLFRLGKTILVSFGVAEKQTGALLGMWLKRRNDPEGVLAAIQFARDQNVADPIAYISAVIQGKSNGRREPVSFTEQAEKLAAEWERREREERAKSVWEASSSSGPERSH